MTSGCITENDLKESHLWQKAYHVIEAVDGIKEDKNMFKYQIVKALIDMQMKNLLAFSSQKLEEFGFSSSDGVKAYYHKNPKETIIGFSAALNEERKYLQEILNDKLYHHYRVIRMTDKAKRIIGDLFKVYMDTPEQLPDSIYQRGRKYKEKEKYEAICNHIASMTDRSAINEHKKLFDPYKKV